MNWLGLDFGTSSAKALVVDDHGTAIAHAAADYPLHQEEDGTREQDPDDYLKAAQAAMRALGPIVDTVKGVGLDGQTPTMVLVDRDGRPVRPAIVWQDTRATREAGELAQALGDPVPLLGTSLPWTPGNSPARLKWLARHEPGVIARTAVILQPKDHVGRWLTGVVVSDAWSSKGLCDVRTGMPAEAVLAATGWPASVVPSIASPWSVRGGVTAAAAAATGLREGTPVTVGWSDSLAPLLGIGGFIAPSATLATGTSDCVGMTAAAAPADAWPLYSVPSACAPLPVVYGPTQTSGASLQWIATLLGLDPGAALDLSEGAEADDPEPPIFLPFLAGERAPLWRPDIRASFVGIAARHGPADLVRGVLAGVACSGRHILEVAAEKLGSGAPAEVLVGGRTMRHAAWRAVRAEVLGVPLVIGAEPQASALGAAMLAAIAVTGDAPAAVSLRMRGATERIEPTPAGVARGEAVYRRYRAAVDDLVASPSQGLVSVRA